MQLAEGVCPLHDLTRGRFRFNRGGMLLVLHSLLLSHTVSAVGLRIYRVSHGKEEDHEAVLIVSERIIAQFRSATVV